MNLKLYFEGLREPELAAKNRRPLGSEQASILGALIEHKGWHSGCGWIWSNHSRTVRLLESLVRRGLAEHVADAKGYGRAEPGYIATDAGRKVNEALRAEQRAARERAREARA